MIQNRQHPITLHTPAEFRWYLLRFIVFAVGLLTLFLGIGLIGYHQIVGLGWVDSLLNASMILAGMGPVSQMPTDGAKLFASAYAILGGAVYPALTAIVLYPIVHRLMKVLHLQALAAAADPPGDDD
ncbi:MAG: hypothetical protein NTX73_13955 [Rhodobacterales bacterium]|jgi:hypothetical protein|nr:hypothetical protein [Rhodobacterales bacterium]